MSSYDQDRSGGRVTFVSSLVLAFAFLIGGVTQSGGGMPNAAVWIVAGSIASVGAVIGMFIGFYNLGRERGR